jgi:ubiquitin carboxyl-terminal hydrolase L3
MTALATKLGVSPTLTFYDIYSLDPSDLSHIPKPVVALLAVVPDSKGRDADKKREDNAGLGTDYHDSESKSPLVWFKQTIGNACGSYGFIHSMMNGPAKEYILPGGLLDKIRRDALPLELEERAKMLYDSQEFEDAHAACAALGDTVSPEALSEDPFGHYVAFVKVDGHLWELDGDRKGPIDRGVLGDDEDVLSPTALELGLKRIIKVEEESGVGDVYFSALALVGEHKT